jgi:hypothetical protein
MDTTLQSLSNGVFKESNLEKQGQSKSHFGIKNSLDNQIQSISDFSDKLPEKIDDVEQIRGELD